MAGTAVDAVADAALRSPLRWQNRKGFVMANAAIWTDEQLGVLVRMAAGGEAYDAIARAIRRDGNDVLRKAAELKIRLVRSGVAPQRIEVRHRPIAIPEEAAPVPVARRPPRNPVAEAADAADVRALGDCSLVSYPERWRGAPLAVLKLEPEACRWPVGDAKSQDFHFCSAERVILPRRGGETQPSMAPYCSHHHRIATGG
jgi:hypothetical protein